MPPLKPPLSTLPPYNYSHAAVCHFPGRSGVYNVGGGWERSLGLHKETPMTGFRIVRRVLVAMIPVAMAAGLVAGCADIRVDLGDTTKHYGNAYRGDSGSTSKEQAIRIARSAAKARNIDPDNYSISTESVSGGYWVLFDQKSSSCRPAQFAVRVYPEGGSVLMMRE